MKPFISQAHAYNDRFALLTSYARPLAVACKTEVRVVRGGTKIRKTKTNAGKGTPMVALIRLGINALGSSFCEGRIIEADEPIPMRMRAHLHLGKERTRGMGLGFGS